MQATKEDWITLKEQVLKESKQLMMSQAINNAVLAMIDKKISNSKEKQQENSTAHTGIG